MIRLRHIVLGFCAASLLMLAASDFWAWYSGSVPLFIGG